MTRDELKDVLRLLIEQIEKRRTSETSEDALEATDIIKDALLVVVEALE